MFPPWEKLRKRRKSSERARGPPATLLTLTLPPPPTPRPCQRHLPHQSRAERSWRQPGPKRPAGLSWCLPYWGPGQCVGKRLLPDPGPPAKGKTSDQVPPKKRSCRPGRPETLETRYALLASRRSSDRPEAPGWHSSANRAGEKIRKPRPRLRPQEAKETGPI